MADSKDWDDYLNNLDPDSPRVVPLPKQNIVDDSIFGELQSAANANNDKFQELQYGFLETVLLPRVEEERELTATELKSLAINFKKKFIASHAGENNSSLEQDGILLDAFAITSSLDLEFSLEQRNDKTAQLVSKTVIILDQLMDTNFDELSLI